MSGTYSTSFFLIIQRLVLGQRPEGPVLLSGQKVFGPNTKSPEVPTIRRAVKFYRHLLKAIYFHSLSSKSLA